MLVDLVLFQLFVGFKLNSTLPALNPHFIRHSNNCAKRLPSKYWNHWENQTFTFSLCGGGKGNLGCKKCIDGMCWRFLLEPRLTRQNWVSTDEGQPDTECFLSFNQDDFCLSHPHSAKVFCFVPTKISSIKKLIKGKFNKRTIKTMWPNFLALFLSLYIFEEMGSNGNRHKHTGM